MRTSWRSATSCSRASCRTPSRRAAFEKDITYHTMLHEQITRFFSGFRRDAHPMAVMVERGRRALGLLSRQHRHPRSAPAHDRLAPPDREGADDRRDGVQVFGRPALHLSAQPPLLRRELPLHALRGAGGGLRDQSGGREGDGQDLHPARRSRAERLDLDRAHRGLQRRQSVRLHRGRHRLAVGSGPWRRQRSGAQHAAPDRQQGPHPRVHQARQVEGRQFPPDGLRPPGLQELRPARLGDAPELP